MSFFSRFKNVNTRHDEAEKKAFEKIKQLWTALLKEHESASKEYAQISRMWEENTEKGRQAHKLLAIEGEEERIIVHADHYDRSADQILMSQKSFVQKREQNTKRLYQLIVEENNYLNINHKSLQESDYLSKKEILQRIQRINALIPRIADLNFDYASHADDYNRAKSDIADLKNILMKKIALSESRSKSLEHIASLKDEELAIKREDEHLISSEEEVSDKVRKLGRKEQKQGNKLEKDENLDFQKMEDIRKAA